MAVRTAQCGHGIIPAHAGSTPHAHAPGRAAWDHPRSRGEHLVDPHHVFSVQGSSPLTRGALAGVHHDCIGPGIIPAHAGSTNGSPSTSSRHWDHPRSRGEHPDATDAESLVEGSSPLTRGAHALRAPIPDLPGIIPAHAGSTGHRSRRRPSSRDHPRSRGEHARGPDFGMGTSGSSPLTRGAPDVAVCQCCATGIIPAHAGSTGTRSRVPSSQWDHPRSRGEHLTPDFLPMQRTGSSPLTRGAPDDQVADHQFVGIIPAHAGSTYRSSEGLRRFGDHPRSRGEHPLMTLSTIG